MNRWKLGETTKNMDESEKIEKYKQELKQRDARINQLKNEVENVLQQKNKELDALNQKMLSVMDEKDYQIRVNITIT